MRGSPCLPAAAAIAAFLLVPLVPVNADTPAAPTPKIEGADTPDGKKIVEKLNSIILDKVNFEKLDISAVLEFLTEKSKAVDPEHHGIKFHLELPLGAESKHLLHREVSITLDNVPVADLLLYIGQQTNLTYKIEKGIVVFVPFDPATNTRPVNPTPA